jgi:dienelactone hydrolase
VARLATALASPLVRGTLTVLVVPCVAIATGIGSAVVDDDAGAAEITRVVDVQLVDETRATPAIGDFAGSETRELTTTVYLPPTTDPAPLIVLAHGFNGHPRKFTELALHWANAGYAVAVPRFPVSNDEFVAVAGGDFFADRLADLPQQARDVSFVLDEVSALTTGDDSELAGRIDPERIGLYGLSLGSLTVWTTVLGPDASETRVDALMQSDGGFPGETGRLAAVTFPVFMAQSDAERGPFDPAVVVPQYQAIPTEKYMLVLHGAVHATVAENTPTKADEAYRIATTVFWDRTLGGTPDEPFPESIVIDGVTTLVQG